MIGGALLESQVEKDEAEIEVQRTINKGTVRPWINGWLP